MIVLASLPLIADITDPKNWVRFWRKVDVRIAIARFVRLDKRQNGASLWKLTEFAIQCNDLKRPISVRDCSSGVSRQSIADVR